MFGETPGNRINRSESPEAEDFKEEGSERKSPEEGVHTREELEASLSKEASRKFVRQEAVLKSPSVDIKITPTVQQLDAVVDWVHAVQTDRVDLIHIKDLGDVSKGLSQIFYVSVDRQERRAPFQSSEENKITENDLDAFARLAYKLFLHRQTLVDRGYSDGILEYKED